jgi:hypothetical protein
LHAEFHGDVPVAHQGRQIHDFMQPPADPLHRARREELAEGARALVEAADGNPQVVYGVGIVGTRRAVTLKHKPSQEVREVLGGVLADSGRFRHVLALATVNGRP